MINEKDLQKKKGFTLIELLVALSIIGMIFTFGFAYYQDFNRRQVVNQAAKELKNNLRLAQSKALAGEKPEGCQGQLEGYLVEFGLNEYIISAKCSLSGKVDSSSIVYPLVSGVQIVNSPGTIVFNVLSLGVSEPGVITLSGTNYSNEVEVKEGGEISIDDSVPYTSMPTPTPSPSPAPTPTCVEEGDVKIVYPGMPDCCPGLNPIGNYTINKAGQCQPLLGGEVCAYCPNGVCGLGEDYCNCPEDCGTLPTPTPSCVPEGGTKLTSPGAPDCCPGLALLVNYTIDEEGVCHPLYGGGVCAYCPDDQCGLGEDYCNCPEDCCADRFESCDVKPCCSPFTCQQFLFTERCF